jgi:3-oxoacyl-[acyl-carrier-protein] synthase-3
MAEYLKQRYKAVIRGTGHFLPEDLITNKWLETQVDTTDQWVQERTGISVRHRAAATDATSDLCTKAAERALAVAGLSPKDLDLILCATITPDHLMPSTACLIQEKLKAASCMAFDLNAACTGWIYAMSIADQFISSGHMKNILVVGGEVLTRFVDYQDRNVAILFGDGAGATVVSRAAEGEESFIYSYHNYAEGQLADLLYLPCPGSRMPPTHEAIDRRDHVVKMRGKEIFKNAVRTMARCGFEALETNKIDPDRISWVIPHQANVRIIEAVAEQMKFPMERVIVEIADMGNTSAGTIPISFDRAIRDGRVQRGQDILFVAFGGGLTSGSLLMRY